MPEQDNLWFEACFDTISQFMGILDGRGNVIKANRAALELTGLTQAQVTGAPLWSIPWPALSRQNRQTLKRAAGQASRGKLARNELEVRRRGQADRIIDFSIRPILDGEGALKFLIAEGRDITLDKRTTEALFQSEARFQTIFEKAGTGIVIKGVDGKMLDCNPAFQTMLGYAVEELRQLDYLAITHPLDKKGSQKLFNELVAGKRTTYFSEKRYVHKEGPVVWCRTTSSLVQGMDGQAKFVIAMVENISAQKQIEAELAELQRRLMQGREMERRRVAQDLHDGPLQEIIAVSFQVQDLKNALTADADSQQLQSLQNALMQSIKSIRSVCGELRRPALAGDGLEKTILSHAEEFQNAHPELTIDLDLANDGQSLPEPGRIVLFRIYQEAFNNIVRHAQASHAWVRFKFDDAQALLEVQDDGVGFELPGRWIKLARQGHLGLVGAMERAKEAGGEFKVVSTPGQGTLVQATIPIKEESNL